MALPFNYWVLTADITQRRYDGQTQSINQMTWWWKLIATCMTSLALLVHLLHPPTFFSRLLSLLVMLLLWPMSLSTPVNISQAAWSCIISEMELQPDVLSDTLTELKIIVTLVLGSHTSQTAILLGSTTVGEIREMDWTRRKERGRDTQRLEIERQQLTVWRGG